MTGHPFPLRAFPLRRLHPRSGVVLLLTLGLFLPRPGLAQSEVQPAIGPLVADGEAQVVEAFTDSTRWIREQLWVETEVDSDGDGRLDRVHVSVVRPRETGTLGLRVPVIYESSPYYAGTAQVHQILWDVRHELGREPPSRGPQPEVPFQPERRRISNSHVETWVPRGFAVVHSEAPGTGLSQGCPTMGGTNESLAPKAVIDWLNGRARGFTSPDGNREVTARWATGKVGMTGSSFNGTLSLAAATTGVQGLEAIIPIAPNTSYWHYYRSHGLIRSPGGYLGEDIDGLYDFVYSGRPERRSYCNSVVREGTLLAGMDRVTGNWNDFWAERDYALQTGGIRAAVLIAHGWNDWNVMPEHSVRVIERLRSHGAPLQMYFHQGGHGGAPPLRMMNRWFTRFLLDVENGVEHEPRAWIVREGDDPMNPTPYPDYPHPEAAPVTLLPGAGGTAAGTLTLGGTTPGTKGGRTLETLVDDVALSGTDLAKAERSLHRLLYRTGELQQPIHISGTPGISLRLASNRSAVNLSVWLVALPWEESAPREPEFSVITRGWADPQNHRSLRESDPLVPGEFRSLSFTLQPTDQVIPAGRRVALLIFSSDQDFTLWPEPGAEITLDLSGSELVLPVVGGTAALHQALKSGR